MWYPSSPSGESLLLRQRRAIFDVSFKGNATPALVLHSSDVPGAVFLASEGSDDAAADDAGCNFGTLLNNDTGESNVGILVDAKKALGGKIEKLYSLDVSEVTSTAGTITVALKGDSSSGITASGNVAFTIDGATGNLASETITYRVVLECSISNL